MEDAMNQSKFDALRELYPDVISLDQMRVICKISKRMAKYLVQHNIIPATDTGKKSWRYRIALDDVIDFLCNREEKGSMIPAGVCNSRKKVVKERKYSHRRSFSEVAGPENKEDLAEYFNYVYSDYDEILTVEDIADMTGVSSSTVIKWIRAGHIKPLQKYPKFFIPKQYLMEFVLTPKYLETKSNSEFFKKILGGYELWINAKLSQ
jgi:excisionase family DNA binding protein